MPIKRGEVWLCDFDEHPDSRQNGVRPAVVVQSNQLNQVPSYRLTIVVPFSTKGSTRIPSQVEISPSASNGLSAVSFAKCEQMQTIPQSHLQVQKGIFSLDDLGQVDAALKRTLGLDS